MRRKKTNTRKKNFAKKELGQNFLNNPIIRENILTEAGNIKNKNILEIGPGLGFLTTKLLQESSHLTAIEFDERAVQILNKDFGNHEHFHLIHGDILIYDLDILFEQKKYSIIANIPYNITAPIFKKVLSKTKNKPEFAVFMVQKEVGKKVCNPIKRSILSISVEIFAETKYCFTVTRENFTPIPKVDSAIIRLDIRKKPLVPKDLQQDFFTVVNAGFSQKRKKLGNFIGKFFGLSPKDLLGTVNPDRRAETLNIKDWIQITKNFKKLMFP
ncbi:ribosomal RNA small subunit methyltransferase A [Candidatus Gracilibacteria bacterium]|nr:ribosomal RNA small subunit methyltransferase A [Candidatus Gracilibacteria bacterium]